MPTYVSHIFAAGIQSSHRVESCHPFFKKFFQLRNTLLEFIVWFEAGLRAQHFNDLKADFKAKDTNPTMKTTFKIEKLMSRKTQIFILGGTRKS